MYDTINHLARELIGKTIGHYLCRCNNERLDYDRCCSNESMIEPQKKRESVSLWDCELVPGTVRKCSLKWRQLLLWCSYSGNGWQMHRWAGQALTAGTLVVIAQDVYNILVIGQISRDCCKVAIRLSPVVLLWDTSVFCDIGNDITSCTLSGVIVFIT